MATVPYEVYKLLEEYDYKPILKAEIKEELTKELSTKVDVAEVRSEVAEVRSEVAEVRSEVGKVRSELKAEIAQVRSELRAEIAEVRTELKNEIAQVRLEFKEEIKSLEIRLTREIESVESDVRIIKVLTYILFFLIVLLNGDKFAWILDSLKFFITPLVLNDAYQPLYATSVLGYVSTLFIPSLNYLPTLIPHLVM